MKVIKIKTTTKCQNPEEQYCDKPADTRSPSEDIEEPDTPATFSLLSTYTIGESNLPHNKEQRNVKLIPFLPLLIQWLPIKLQYELCVCSQITSKVVFFNISVEKQKSCVMHQSKDNLLTGVT